MAGHHRLRIRFIPTHTPGTYSVSLEARDSCTGNVNRSDRLSYITVTATAGTLAISSIPPGATVYIDNVVKGITPVTLTDTAARQSHAPAETVGL